MISATERRCRYFHNPLPDHKPCSSPEVLFSTFCSTHLMTHEPLLFIAESLARIERALGTKLEKDDLA